MSLLIDALRQAESAQRKLSPASEKPETPDLELELNEAPIQSAPRQAAPPSRPPEQQFNQAQVRQSFELKQAPNNSLPLILAAGGLLALIAGGIYLWWATQGSQSSIQPVVINTPETMTTPPDSKTKPVQQENATPLPAKQSASASHEQVPVKDDAPRPAAAGKPVATERKLFTTGAVKRNPPNARAAISPLQQAYMAYQNGQFSEAYALFEHIIQTDPANTEALNALGLIALRAGRTKDAEQYFRRALQADPKNAQALSQLAGLLATSNPATAESRLKSLLAEQPESAEALFALGSLQARQGRWVEAQQNFFQAHSLDKQNPDTLYNLAVALDHLNQPRLAAQYYEQASIAAQTGTSAFDPALARQRANALNAALTSPAP